MKKITPKLRFNGFEQNWQSNSFGQIVSNKSKKYNPSLADEDFPCIELDCVSQESGQLLKTYSAKQQSSIKNVFFQGDVLFGKLRPYLKKYLYTTFDGVCSTEFWVLTGKQVTNKFLYQYIQTNTFVESAKKSSGSKMPRADWDIVSSEQFYFPSDKEQNKIADFLSLVDENITLQTRKVELLQQYKKGMMQKLFSQKIRFKNDSGDFYPSWETTALGKMANFYKGKGISKQDITSKGENECIRYGELYTHYNEKINHILSKTNLSSSESLISHYGDILIPSSGETAEDISKASTVLITGVLLGGDLNIIRLKNDYNSLLLAYYLTHYKKKEISKLAQGNSVVHLYAKELKSLEITLPSSLDEQVKIANFFSSIDDKITLENTKLDILKQWKQGLLQQMFV
ncbi:restriction endonuclease subunit S [Providencia sp. R33]|uniref:restriction endonuclease subunit S n=1 Tax=Providencia sp. R33 TaxID=2828763 RepID=UPI001C5B7617|nr:restriction endonuclease subunit S [Providencia sp. R33]QXX82772.1 restriction endonuclease subunit S [Providencia sp. R33]